MRATKRRLRNRGGPKASPAKSGDHVSEPSYASKNLPAPMSKTPIRVRAPFLVDLEQAQKVLLRLMTQSGDRRLASRPYRAQAHLLCAGLLSRLAVFTKTLQALYDHSGQT